jgi:hypothetical protein
MSLTWATFTTQLANFLVVPVNDPNFIIALPSIVDDAEQMSYRDLDLLNTVFRDSSVSLTAGNRNFAEAANPNGNGPFLVTQQLNVITPFGTSNPDLGTRNPLLPVAKEMLDVLYPSNTGAGIPVYFAPINQNNFIVAPWPDQNYTIEVVGTQRPAPLSASNTTTLLSTYFPDVFFNASMVIGNGYIKNFGAGSDDPQAAVTWKSKYDASLKSATIEEMRKKFQSEAWSSSSPTPLATPPRT